MLGRYRDLHRDLIACCIVTLRLTVLEQLDRHMIGSGCTRTTRPEAALGHAAVAPAPHHVHGLRPQATIGSATNPAKALKGH